MTRFSGVLGIVPAARVVRLPTWVRSGATRPLVMSPAMEWQLTQFFSLKTSAPFAASAADGGRSRLPLVCEPCAEILGGLREDPDSHVGMPHAAERVTGAQVKTRARDGQPHIVGMAGDDIDLLPERGDPETMDDVCGFEPEEQVFAHRQVNLIGRRHP